MAKKKTIPLPSTPRRDKRPPKVALMIESSNAYARGVLAGVKDYIRTHGPWNVHLAEHGRGDGPPKWIEDWDGDGVIARIENKEIARALAELRVPVVDVSSHRHLPKVPTATSDNDAIAKEAFQHFANHGFQRFAYCGVGNFTWALARGGHFEEAVRAAGYACHHYEAPEDFGLDSDAETDAIATWLEGLPKPVAIFTGYDLRGLQILEACKRKGISVPGEVAVLGVDNDDLLCELSSPPLSSIQPDTPRIGWIAAETLAKMMRGEAVPADIRRVPPVTIYVRQSTDVMAVDDVHVARAGQFIREHAHEGINVQDVVSAGALARRILERRFRALVGRTLHEEIRRAQTQRAKDLLINTGLSLKDIAERIGFRHVEYFTVAFKRETGLAPSFYREEQRSGTPRAPQGPD